jgi:hypothetical protein
MLRPTNIKKQKYHTSISSNQVIWDGPDIPCIDLCKGDTVTEVVYKLANELCKVVKDLDPATYNLNCLNLDECQNITFQQLFQTIITTLFCGDNPLPPDNGGGSGNCCAELPYIPHTVLYTQLGSEPLVVDSMEELSFKKIEFTEYTVPVGGGGVYELMFSSEIGIDFNTVAHVMFVEINNTPYLEQATSRRIILEAQGADAVWLPISYFLSNITLNEGDVINIAFKTEPTSADLDFFLRGSVFKLTKIG